MYKTLIQKRLSTWKEDPRGSMSWFLDYKWLSVIRSIYTLFGYFEAWRWGVRLGDSASIYGKVHFRKCPGSEMYFGNGCTFRSSFRSNMVGINHPCAFSTYSKSTRVSIGDRCGFSGTVIGARESIVLGDNVMCGANCVITDFDWHGIDPQKRRDEDAILSAPIIIGNNVWLGMDVAVLKGVSIGDNSVIAAKSVVTSDIPANVLAAGIPAKVIRNL